MRHSLKIKKLDNMGALLEFFLSIGRIFWIRFLKANNELSHFLNFSSTSDPKASTIYISCRNLMIGKYSGVNYWIEAITLSLINEYNIVIYCQSKKLFKKQTITRGNIEIVLLPLLLSLRLRSMAIETAWSKVLSSELDLLNQDIILIGSISGCETHNIMIKNQLKAITLLVTDIRTHKYPQISLVDKQDLSNFKGRILEYINREAKIIQNPRSIFIADSQAVLENIKILFNLNFEPRTYVIPISAQIDNCLPIQKKREILFIGRADKRKGLEYLIASWALIFDQISGWKLNIATSRGDDLKVYRFLRSRKQKNFYYDLYLNINDDLKHRLLNSASIVVLPSHYESFGIVALEAMQHGCVVVANRVGGIPEVVGVNGILVEADNSLAFGNAMLSLTNSGLILEDLSQKSRAVIKEEFNLEIMRDRIKNLIKSI
jgi:glycosyltransferase involved in cell wall biosynthesis